LADVCSTFGLAMFWVSTSEGRCSLPVMVADWSVPSGVANLLAQVSANNNVEGLGPAPLRRHWSDRCVSPVRPLPTDQTGECHRSDLCRGEPTKDLRTSPGQDPIGTAHVELL
jgi:hypothetical protein